ncbi:hypothetical protein CRUP_037783 [Coryphaenoides rupestris]|nr:hypothetical protein CRUP_037783 [Coryphaenoides rupestris]
MRDQQAVSDVARGKPAQEPPVESPRGARPPPQVPHHGRGRVHPAETQMDIAVGFDSASTASSWCRRSPSSHQIDEDTLLTSLSKRTWRRPTFEIVVILGGNGVESHGHDHAVPLPPPTLAAESVGPPLRAGALRGEDNYYNVDYLSLREHLLRWPDTAALQRPGAGREQSPPPPAARTLLLRETKCPG